MLERRNQAVCPSVHLRGLSPIIEDQRPGNTSWICLKSANCRGGDRFTDETGEWEIVGPPSTFIGGKTVRARVRKVGEPAVTEERVWDAHELVAVRRR